MHKLACAIVCKLAPLSPSPTFSDMYSPFHHEQVVSLLIVHCCGARMKTFTHQICLVCMHAERYKGKSFSLCAMKTYKEVQSHVQGF